MRLGRASERGPHDLDCPCFAHGRCCCGICRPRDDASALGTATGYVARRIWYPRRSRPVSTGEADRPNSATADLQTCDCAYALHLNALSASTRTNVATLAAAMMYSRRTLPTRSRRRRNSISFMGNSPIQRVTPYPRESVENLTDACLMLNG